ncbi:hypothetical protein OG883_33040 [Streptomyces sp. NBC_01142]|uniref:hypothetical protein n=1 Tax=Streptomyces sp. NBC_01142 TaxID=2975865 RepID=UPI002258EEB3|nr:hypothetical protein [Streptomyces sp. NBC_01142]MCX4824601.1 hypothetical protein [Streptomyces sp. NBC_01142]
MAETGMGTFQQSVTLGRLGRKHLDGVRARSGPAGSPSWRFLPEGRLDDGTHNGWASTPSGSWRSR